MSSNNDVKILSILDTRLPKWDSKNLFVRPCPICNNNINKVLYLRPDHLNVRLCLKCGTYFVSPVPSIDYLNNFYETYHEEYSRMPKYSSQHLKKIYDEFEPLGDIMVKKLYSLLRIKNAKILDIGFGQPFLLYLLKQLGAKTFGVDMDAKAIEYASYMKIDSIHKGDFLTYNTNEIFDTIIMTNFIEHPLAPMAYINRAYTFLKKGGFLLIWTPNGKAAVEDDEPITFRVDLEHMQYFTNQTVTFINDKLNMEIVHFETLDQHYLSGSNEDRFEQNQISKYRFGNFLKSAIKNFVRKNILKEGSGKRILPIPIGNYHLFTVLKKI